MAQRFWEDQLDYVTDQLWEPLVPGRAPATVDPRISEVRADVERLHGAVKLRDRATVNRLLIAIAERLEALAAEPVVA